MDRKLFDAIMSAREKMKDPAFWKELEKKWDARQKEFEQEQRAMRMTHEEMNRPFDL